MTSRGLPAGSGMVHTYALWVWPVTSASTRGSSSLAMSTIGPEMPVARAARVAVVVVRPSWPGAPPSWISATIDLTPMRVEHLGVLVDRLDLVVELQARRPDGGDDVRRALQGHADEADRRRRSRFQTQYGGSSGWRVLSSMTLRGEVREVGARERLRPGRSSRRSGGSRRSAGAPARPAPSSNSWLPTAVTSRPSLFSASMVGSSWKSGRQQRAGADHVAGGRRDASTGGPRGPAQVRGEVLDAARPVRLRGAVRAGRSVTGRRSPPGGSRLPWKSLKDSSWTSMVDAGLACAGVENRRG